MMGLSSNFIPIFWLFIDVRPEKPGSYKQEIEMDSFVIVMSDFLIPSKLCAPSHTDLLSKIIFCSFSFV